MIKMLAVFNNTEQSEEKLETIKATSKVKPKDPWSVAIFWGAIAGLLFRIGFIMQSSGIVWGVLLSVIGFIVGLIPFSMRPIYRPFLGILLGFALAEGANSLWSLLK